MRLSPNATNREAPRSGTRATVTVKVHRSVRCTASVAVHVVVDVPTGNAAPDGGEQEIDTGAVPPETVGAAYVTEALLLVVCALWLAGHVSFGPSVGGEGSTGLSPSASRVSTSPGSAP